MNKMLLEFPSEFETERLMVRGYRAGDGEWYYPMSQGNQEHLLPYEAGNPALSLKSVDDAEILMRTFAAYWVSREAFFMGAFDKATGEFVAQLYMGVVNWDLPEFVVGYFVDVDHEGKGFVTEMVKGALAFIFEHFKAERVRLGCSDRNARSYGVAERCGFTREAHFRKVKRWSDGSYTGEYIYCILKEEFEAKI